MGWQVLVLLLALVQTGRAQDTHHEALLEYFEQEQREELGSGWGTEGDAEEEEEAAPPTRILRCIKCSPTVDEPDVCKPPSLRTEMHDFIVECTGLCLNISTVNETGDSVLEYDCANDRHGRKDKCLSMAGTRICVCGSDLCNGPEEVFTEDKEEEFYDMYTPPPGHSKEIVPQRSHDNSCSFQYISFNTLALSAFIVFINMYSLVHV